MNKIDSKSSRKKYIGELLIIVGLAGLFTYGVAFRISLNLLEKIKNIESITTRVNPFVIVMLMIDKVIFVFICFLMIIAGLMMLIKDNYLIFLIWAISFTTVLQFCAYITVIRDIKITNLFLFTTFLWGIIAILIIKKIFNLIQNRHK